MARFVVLLTLLFIWSCEEFGSKCGQGTTDRDGVCVADPVEPGPTCGPGTKRQGDVCLPTTTSTVPTELTCGEGTQLEGTTCVPIPPVPGLERLIEFACPGDRCLGSKVIEYWTTQVEIDNGTSYADNAVVRTVAFNEVGGALSFQVSDGTQVWDCMQGVRCDGLVFAAGIPVTLTVTSPAANLAAHTFTSPQFFRAVAWYRVDSADTDYRAFTFDSIDLKKDAADTSVNLSFVPMVPGEYPVYCADNVADGDRYAEIALGTVVPNFGTGHAGQGLHALIAVEDPDALLTEVTFSQDALADRDAALDSDPRRDPAWWNDPTLLEVEGLENSSTSFEFRHLGNALSEAAPLVLTEDRGHSIRLLNRSETRRHTLTVPQLYARSVFLSLEDSQAEVRLPHPNSFGVKAGKEATMHLVPTQAVIYEAFCDVGVRYGAHGAADFGTGHPRFGMHGPIIVRAETSTTGR